MAMRFVWVPVSAFLGRLPEATNTAQATGQNVPGPRDLRPRNRGPACATDRDVCGFQGHARILRESAMGLVVGLLFFTRHASRAHDLAVDEFFPGEEGS